MDEIDRAIVRLLLSNGRLSQEQIARAVHLSRPAVHERMKRLEETGVIRGYQAQIDWEAFGLPLTSFTLVSSIWSAQQISETIGQLNMEDAMLEECYSLTGEWCIVIKTRVASPRALEQFVSRIRNLPGVQNTLTMLALSTYYENGRQVSEAAHMATNPLLQSAEE
jgi:Lrp/AsnC family leucine-responsive transcriptional regulator